MFRLRRNGIASLDHDHDQDQDHDQESESTKVASLFSLLPSSFSLSWRTQHLILSIHVHPCFYWKVSLRSITIKITITITTKEPSAQNPAPRTQHPHCTALSSMTKSPCSPSRVAMQPKGKVALGLIWPKGNPATTGLPKPDKRSANTSSRT